MYSHPVTSLNTQGPQRVRHLVGFRKKFRMADRTAIRKVQKDCVAPFMWSEECVIERIAHIPVYFPQSWRLERAASFIRRLRPPQ